MKVAIIHSNSKSLSQSFIDSQLSICKENLIKKYSDLSFLDVYHHQQINDKLLETGLVIQRLTQVDAVYIVPHHDEFDKSVRVIKKAAESFGIQILTLDN